MRKATICLLLLVCSLAAFGQNEPQWRVVKTGVLVKSNQTGFATLFTPQVSGLYRITGYISTNEGGQEFGVTFAWTDVSGFSAGSTLTATFGNPAQIVLPFFPSAGTPATYFITGTVGTYNLAYTIEQLQ